MIYVTLKKSLSYIHQLQNNSEIWTDKHQNLQT